MTSEFYRNKRALITGGLGFIGSNLALRLVELGADVTLVDSMLPAYGATLANIEPIRDRVHVNFSDVRDPHSMRHLIRERDLIFSLAGQVSHSESMRDPMTDLEINRSSSPAPASCTAAPSTSPWTRSTPWSRWT
jgi:nucleoside-diphosphate-sugar epimerase